MITASYFDNYYPIVEKIIDDFLKSMTVDFARNHFMELLKYSTSGGKKFRGILTSSIYCDVLHISPDSKEAYPGYILGWALEVCQAAFLVADDLMDQSQTRRGRPCWYLRENVGNSAVNDALIVENFTFVLIESLRKNDEKEKCLPDSVIDNIILLLRKVNATTTIGQGYDFKCRNYSLESYNTIATCKTSYYTTWSPIILGIVATDKISEDIWSKPRFRDLLLKIGYYFQVQDDFLDVYGDHSVTGKVGTDISEGKVTWIACTALENANEQQKEIFLNNIGKTDKECQDRVRKIYDELNMKQFYASFVEKEGKIIEEEIEALDEVYPKDIIYKLYQTFKSRNH